MSVADASRRLHACWSAVDDWHVTVVEPPDNQDLGSTPLERLVLARLTEVEVHGTDLGLDLGPWSDVFVLHVLPTRLDWLNSRGSNHRDVDTSIHASWLLVATDTERSQVVTVAGPSVVSRPGDDADTRIVGTAAELLAPLLGRAPTGSAPPDFALAFPGP